MNVGLNIYECCLKFYISPTGWDITTPGRFIGFTIECTSGRNAVQKIR